MCEKAFRAQVHAWAGPDEGAAFGACQMDEKRGAHAQDAAHAICLRLENSAVGFYVEQAERARHLLALASALAR